jgi:DNA-binding MarR family transcriptional regulator
VTNIDRRPPAVKRSSVSPAEDSAASPSGARSAGHPPLGRSAVEISKLLVEVLQVGHAGRRGGPDAGAPIAEDATGAHGPAGDMADGAAVAPAPLSSHVIRAAIHIYGNGPQTIGQLAAGLGVSQGWASRVVDEMERAGYVARERDPGDRRVVRVSLVPAAVERVEKAYRWRGDAVEAALQDLSPAERTAVATFLRRFVDEVRASSR